MKEPAGSNASKVLEQALGALPASVREELRARLDGADSLVITHQRDTRFRWMSLFSFPFKLLLWSLILLVLLWVFFQNLTSDSGDSDGGDTPRRPVPQPESYPRYDGSRDSAAPIYVRRVERPGRSWLPDFLRFRFTTPVHTVEVVSAPSSAPPLRFQVSSERQGRATVAALYAVASAAGLKLLELNQGPPSLVLHRGHGRLPLMVDPGALDLEWARSELAVEGFERVVMDGCVELRRAHAPTPKGFAWVFLVGMLLVSPAFVWFAGFRRHLLDSLLDVRGEPPGVDVFFVDGTAVGFCYKRAGRAWSRVVVPRSRLHAIVFAEELGFDDQVSYGEPRLRLIGNGTVYPVEFSLGDKLGNAIRDLLVSEVLAPPLQDGGVLARPLSRS